MRIEKTFLALILALLSVTQVISNSDLDDFEQGNNQKYVIEGKTRFSVQYLFKIFNFRKSL